MRYTLNFTGHEALLRRLDILEYAGDQIVESALEEAGLYLQGEVEVNAPFDDESKHSQHLQSKIWLGEVREDPRNNCYYVVVGPHKGDSEEPFYGKYTEWGTVTGVKAEHWLRNTARQNKTYVTKMIIANIERKLEEYWNAR